MSKTLAGSVFVRSAIEYDYCIESAIQSLKALCDKVVVFDVGSIDGTKELVEKFSDSKTIILSANDSLWNMFKGREKLAHFTNIAMSVLDCDWNINIQADETLSENSFEAIRQAINEPEGEGYFVTRYNLWGNSQHYLDVEDSRKPVGQQILRLAKAGYWSIDDAQSLHCPNARWDYLDKIRIYHAGFVRDKYKHIPKIENMLVNVFGLDMDKKVLSMKDGFDPFLHFSKEDLKPIPEPLPIFMQDWANERDRINNVII